MADQPETLDLDALERLQEQQATVVRALKDKKAPKAEVEVEVEKLKAIKARVAAAKKASEKEQFNRTAFEETLKRRFFIAPSFQIYNGVAGLYDYGPPGCSIKANFLSLWREHFIIEEGMLEIDCTNVTPHCVLEASGHVEKFADLMVKDVKTLDCYRADKLLEEVLSKELEACTNAERKDLLRKTIAQADAFSLEEMTQKLKEFNVKALETGNDLTDPFPFNLMFATQIGPRGDTPGFLRPETAQGMFVNFRRLLEFNGNRLPFAAAQIGRAFRNEIAPRSGLLRVREFEMCEIEHFVKGTDKTHPKFDKVADVEITLFGRDNQVTDGKTQKMTVREAVSRSMINNETLAYFMARTHLLLLKIGLRPERIRFRQHLRNEMAHYACDCWDAELLTSYGWVECVGHADRACYDLSKHSEASKVDLTAYEEFAEPQVKDVFEAGINRGVLGKLYRTEAKQIMEHLTKIGEDDIEAAKALEAQLEANGEAKVTVEGKEYSITREHVKFTAKTRKINGRNYHPSVIEPSFGVGRIIYALLEQSYYTRESDEQRAVFSLPACIAPFKVSVLPLSGHSDFVPAVRELDHILRSGGISCRVDDSGVSIGRRYARADELGVPFAITIDFETKAEQTVTMRERDSCQQVRLPIAQVLSTLRDLVSGSKTWENVRASFPNVTVSEQ